MSVSTIIKRYERNKGGRANWDAHWKEVADYVIPKKDDIYIKQRNVGGEKKGNVLVFDATAIHANELLASALHGMLTNPAVSWFELSFGEDMLDNNHGVRKWLQDTAQLIHNTLNNTNFQTEIHEIYLDLGSFGTALLRVEEDDELDVIFNARPINEAYLEEDYNGVVNALYREYMLTGRQLLSAFPDAEFSVQDKSQIQRDLDKEHEILHAVYQRDDAELNEQKRGPTAMKYASKHILLKKKLLLKESGFEEFPYITPRWTKISGEIYGRSPAMKSLPDIKMVNKMMKTVIKAAQKVVDPPLQVPDDGVVLPIRTIPGGTNYYRAGTKDRIEPLNTGSRPDIGVDILGMIQQRIRDAFFIDQLQLNEGPQMTATEVMQRTEEKLRLLGPILGRQHYELLKPLVNRVYNILVRKGKVPPPPEIIAGRQFEVRYSSMIARAQRSAEADNITRIFNLVGPFAQADPTVMDNFNTDQLVRYVGNIYNSPVEIFRPEKEVQRVRQQRNEMIQKQQQQQQQTAEADTLQKISSATKG